MAFLDNSGDIILDAVLTDTGRFRLAKGDGSFRITKFVFADDEINYRLYDKNSASGSAYYDLSILQTPVFEAFTNNTSVVKSPLLSILNQNLLYLPVMALNTYGVKNPTTPGRTSTGDTAGTPFYASTNLYMITCDSGSTTTFQTTTGVFNGWNSQLFPSTAIRVDQGLNTTERPATEKLSETEPQLLETQFIVEIDHRLGRLIIPNSQTNLFTPSFVDDDQVASYLFTSSDGNIEEIDVVQNAANFNDGQVILGPKGNLLALRPKASLDLQQSTYLFLKLGSTVTISGTPYYYIDSYIRVRGVTTGSSITIPIRFIRKQ